jgi:multidrug efflux system outer membrane protein
MAPVISVPAEVLAQRPDIFNAAREVDAARLEVGSARAQRFPRLSLSGSSSPPKPHQRLDAAL